ncbi:hypothetical protein HFN51_04455 [Rhizobium leguminosarum]|nr:hypothetical protein [Rhizobium leguminosarum]
MRNIIVKSTTKTFFCHPHTGENIGRARYGNHVIERFDLPEFIEAHGFPLPETIDIIDLGYWYVPFDNPLSAPLYEPPVWHTRDQEAA